MSDAATEVNFDGIVGPTHNYAGLSYGNVASMKNRRAASNPREAALQGLSKMKLLHDLGVPQAVLPPHERPHLPTLRRLGYTGNDADVLRVVAHANPSLLSFVSSASAMWAANAATVSPSCDTLDHRVHFTPANLISNLHRSIEPPTTARVLRAIFADERCFVHHDPLPATIGFADEGAANHTRLGATFGRAGVEIFTFGRGPEGLSAPQQFPARQTLEACCAVANMHRLQRDRVRLVQQHPSAVDAGAFHNDVVAVGHRNLLVYHRYAWVHPEPVLEHLSNFVTNFQPVEVTEEEVPLAAAIGTYLFNSQLVTLPDGSIAMIAPMESREDERVHAYVQSLVQRGVLSALHFVDLRESMRNGGGPACLRLRVELTNRELVATHAGVFLTPTLYDQLTAWVTTHYRERLTFDDLADPKLLAESRAALDELTRILGLGPIYDFQQ